MKTSGKLLIAFLLLLISCTTQTAQKPEPKPQASLEKVSSPESQSQRKQGELFKLADGTSARFYGEADVKDKDRITVEIGSAGDGVYYFTPTVLVGRPGQSIALEVFNRDSQGHPFQVKGQGGFSNVAPGRVETLAVTFPTSGAVTFSCPHEGHAGELRVG